MIYDFDKFSSGDFIIFPNNDLWQRAGSIKNIKIMEMAHGTPRDNDAAAGMRYLAESLFSIC